MHTRLANLRVFVLFLGKFLSYAVSRRPPAPPDTPEEKGGRRERGGPKAPGAREKGAGRNGRAVGRRPGLCGAAGRAVERAQLSAHFSGERGISR